MKVHKSQLVVRLIKVRIQFDRPAIRLNRLFVRESFGGRPHTQPPADMADDEVPAYRNSYFQFDYRIRVLRTTLHGWCEISPVPFLGEGNPRETRGDICIGRAG